MQPAMHCEADLSELEQQQGPLVENVPGGRQGRALQKGVLAATVGAALLGAAAFAVLYARHPAAVGAQGAAERESADLIQSYALKENGRTLTREELSEVQGSLPRTRAGHIAVGLLRNLEGEGKGEEDEEDNEVPTKCKKALSRLMGVYIGTHIDLSIKHTHVCWKCPERKKGQTGGIECTSDRSSQKCKESEERKENYPEAFRAGCKKTGDVCTVNQEYESGEVFETKVDFCMPTECQAGPKAAYDYAMNAHGSLPGTPKYDVEDTTVFCGDGAAAEAKAAAAKSIEGVDDPPDMEVSGNEETDGKIKPEFWRGQTSKL